MRKIVLYIIVVIVLIIGAGIIYFTKMGNPFGKDDSDFAIDEINKVTKIVLTSKQGKVELIKLPEGWQVNKRFMARESSVEFLLQVLSRLKIKSPVSDEKFSKETKILTKNVVFIEVFEQLRRIKSFSLYKVNSNSYGNYARKREGTNPYVLYIPGFNKPIGSLFVTEEKFWKPYIIFNYQPGMIKAVKMDYPDSPEKSFRIVKTGDNRYKLLQNGKEVPVFDTLAIERYLSYFRNIRFVRWELGIDSAETDSVISTTPEFILTVTDKTGNHNTIKTYSMLVSLVDRKNMLTASHNEVFVKQNDEKELSVARYFDLDPVIKEIKYFFAKGK
jgi:uncharacterized protein YbdZ (MbtH family)